MPGCARRCSIGSPIRPTLSKQVRSRTVFAGPCGRNAKSDPWRPLFHSASASPYGLRSSRTELYPLNLQRPKVGQIKPPKWAKPTCQKQLLPSDAATVSPAILGSPQRSVARSLAELGAHSFEHFECETVFEILVRAWRL